MGNGGIYSLFDKELNKELWLLRNLLVVMRIEAGYTIRIKGREFTQITLFNLWDNVFDFVHSQLANDRKWSLYSHRLYNSQPTEHATIQLDYYVLSYQKKIDFDVELQSNRRTHNRQYRIASSQYDGRKKSSL